MKNIACVLLLLLLVGCSKRAEEVSSVIKSTDDILINTYKSWHLYKNNYKCYIASYPINSSGNYLEREANYIVISHNPYTKENEFYIVGGLQYDNQAKTTIEINNLSYILANNDQVAWSLNQDVDIIESLAQSPKSILVFNFFENNIHAVDEYSTDGLFDAIKEFKTQCKDIIPIK